MTNKSNRGGKRPGAGRPHGSGKYSEKTKSRTFSLPESLDKVIQDKAVESSVSWSECVVNHLKEVFKLS